MSLASAVTFQRWALRENLPDYLLRSELLLSESPISGEFDGKVYSGQPDQLFRHPKHGLILLDTKLGLHPDVLAFQIQTGIYRELLSLQFPHIPWASFSVLRHTVKYRRPRYAKVAWLDRDELSFLLR